MTPYNPSWFSSAVNPVVHVIIMAGAVWVAWQNRDRRPKAATLFLIAVMLSILDVVLRFLQTSNVVFVTPTMTGKTGMPDLSNLGTWIFLSWQSLKCSLRIMSWCLIAWAVLKQPNHPKAAGHRK